MHHELARVFAESCDGISRAFWGVFHEKDFSSVAATPSWALSAREDCGVGRFGGRGFHALQRRRWPRLGLRLYVASLGGVFRRERRRRGAAGASRFRLTEAALEWHCRGGTGRSPRLRDQYPIGPGRSPRLRDPSPWHTENVSRPGRSLPLGQGPIIARRCRCTQLGL